MNQQIKPKVTIGLPVYNGEQFIRKAIDSILSQTFSDFELIISDNASTDSTQIICEEYVKKDNRIQYFRQEKNIEEKTWLFLLDHAKYDYFVWLAADDYWAPTFLEKNINVLESNKNVVFSAAKVELFGKVDNSLKISQDDSVIKKLYKKTRQRFRPHHYNSVSGSYEKKVNSILRKSTHLLVYSVFRTDVLKKVVSIVWDHNPIFDRIITLAALRFGDSHVVDEVLMYRYAGDVSSNVISAYIAGKTGLRQMFFSKVSFTRWCWKNLGKKIFLRNMDYFVRLNLSNTVFVFISLIRLLIHSIVRNS